MESSKNKEIFKKYIKDGFLEDLQNIPFHGKAPIKRLSLLNNKIIPESNTYISVHFIKNLPKKIPKYTELHKHDYDEINIIISEDEELKYRFQFENEIYEVKSPSTVYIPKGVKHSAEVISGKGSFICIILNGEYKATK